MQSHRLSDTVTKTDIARSVSVAQAFDSIAPVFDSRLENGTTRRLRAKIYSVVESLLQPGSTILDINCGTGIDALSFANHGFRVFGSDISEQMIKTARSKSKREKVKNVKFNVASFESISRDIVPTVDLVLSNFGGLNCTSNLAAAARAIASVTKPGGYFVAVIMPPFSLWESISYLARFEWRNATRRLHKSAPATGFLGKVFPVYYYTPRATTIAFSPYFERMQIVGLSIVSPTPQSTRFVNQHPRLTRTLVNIDGYIEAIPLIRAAGDHYMIVLKRK